MRCCTGHQLLNAYAYVDIPLKLVSHWSSTYLFQCVSKASKECLSVYRYFKHFGDSTTVRRQSGDKKNHKIKGRLTWHDNSNCIDLKIDHFSCTKIKTSFFFNFFKMKCSNCRDFISKRYQLSVKMLIWLLWCVFTFWLHWSLMA